MAAKKAPAKKMAAPKAAAKKTGSAAQFRKAEEAGKKKQSERTRVSSANAAENRANTKRYMSKQTSQNDMRQGDYYESWDGPVRGGKKTAMDARGKDKKYGRLVGPTTVEAGQTPRRISQNQQTQSVFEDARGDQWVITRAKTNRRFLPDKNNKPQVTPYKVKPTSAAAFRKAETASNKKKKK
jgi:hypothetical protein